jgi:hypothetical protein
MVVPPLKQTWIGVTASMEHVATARTRGGPLLDLAVPSHIERLAEKVLAGDTDAIHLLGTPPDALLRSRANDTRHAPPEPPTAIRAEFYKYTFSSWQALRQDGRWWERELLSTPTIFERRRGRRSAVRRSPWQRHWLLVGSVVGVYLSLRCLLRPRTASSGGACVRSFAVHALSTCANVLTPLAALAAYLLIGMLTLFSDYLTVARSDQPIAAFAQRLTQTTGLRSYAGVIQLLPAFGAMALAHLFALLALGRGGDAPRRRLVRGTVLPVIQLIALPLALLMLARGARELVSSMKAN